jgi:hypothetical protein
VASGRSRAIIGEKIAGFAILRPFLDTLAMFGRAFGRGEWLNRLAISTTAMLS